MIPADLHEMIEAPQGGQAPQLPVQLPEGANGAESKELYSGASTHPFSPDVCRVLMLDFDESAIEIKPHNGVVYLPGTFYRQRLNQAFGPGGWAMIPRGPRTMKDSQMFREYALYALGRFVAEAVGNQEYISTNRDMTEADAAEGCKTNAIQRCCKDLGIASKLWEPSFIAAWKVKYAAEVYVRGKDRPQWRRKDRPALYGETGIVDARPAGQGVPASVPAPTRKQSASQSPPPPPTKAAKPAEEPILIVPTDQPEMTVSDDGTIRGSFDIKGINERKVTGGRVAYDIMIELDGKPQSVSTLDATLADVVRSAGEVAVLTIKPNGKYLNLVAADPTPF